MRIILSLLLSPIPFLAFSQYPGWISKSFSHDKTQTGWSVMEFNNHFYVTIDYGAEEFINVNAPDFIPSISKLDQNLNTIDSVQFPRVIGHESKLTKLHVINGYIYAHLLRLNLSNPFSSIHELIKLDEDLNIINTTQINTNVILEKSTVFNDNKIAFIGKDTRVGNSIVVSDTLGNVLSTKEIELDTAQFSFTNFYIEEFHYAANINSFLISGFASHEAIARIFINSISLDIDSIGVPSGLGNISYYGSFSQKDSNIYCYSNSLSIPAGYTPFSIIKFSDKYVPEGKNDIPSIQNTPHMYNSIISALSIHSDGSLYFLHSEDISISGGLYSQYIIISKFDSNVNIIWRKEFLTNTRGNPLVDLYPATPLNIIATNDGGCLVSFHSNWMDTTKLDHINLFLLKLDANGSALAQTSFDLPAAQHQCYPNPGQNAFYLNLGEKFENTSVEVALYNAAGQKVLSQHLHNPAEAVNTENLSSGFYFYEASAHGRPIAKGKWVKE